MSEEMVVLEKHGRVGSLEMSRTQQGGQVCLEMLQGLVKAFADCDADPDIGAILLTGSEKAFATGPDAAEMLAVDFASGLVRDEVSDLWQALASHRKPLVAAVSGYAMGAGCSLVLLCDVVVASETARFGQPDLTMGSLPAVGTLNRLARIVGRIKAMDMALTGRIMTADEAELAGLVSRIVPAPDLADEARELAERIASMSLPLVLMAKESIDKASETGVLEGQVHERRLIEESRVLDDHREGLSAVLENRQPAFQNK
ncbi:MAG TPA: enoyl-CoA hydratase [Rhodospirillaceae bacterium]|nr:MAG: hypothetical protein A2018_07705 [Alphaproteobacteria bacterium GWF2_58_20]HAU29184.1 enoyl-CoA hydratase [Rhodospirillaceae bacterium]